MQLALRLLIPSGSRLLELDDVQSVIGEFDEPALLYRWRHPDPEVDATGCRGAAHRGIQRIAPRDLRLPLESGERAAASENLDLLPRAAIPYLDEPWYC